MKLVKTTFLFFLNFILIFIIFNILLSFFWEFRTEKKLKNFNPYTNTALELLELNRDQARKLYIETWIDRKYEYDQFVEWGEGETKDKNFVNISKENGRKIINNKNCKKNFYFYGGSETFGYNVTDYQTFSQYFKDILDKEFPNNNFCVFNHGRAGFSSPWMTFLFQKHLIKGKIKENDFIFFIGGPNEKGLSDGINTGILKSFQNAATFDYWDIYKPSLSIFWKSIPSNQLIARLRQKFGTSINDNNIVCNLKKEIEIKIDSNAKCLSNEEVVKTFEDFTEIRKAICDAFRLKCHIMIRPAASINGNYYEKYEESLAIETRMLRDIDKSYDEKIDLYNLMKNAKGVVDITGALDNQIGISYMDRSHFSPVAHKAIAEYIYEIIKLEIN